MGDNIAVNVYIAVSPAQIAKNAATINELAVIFLTLQRFHITNEGIIFCDFSTASDKTVDYCVQNL